MRDLNKIIIHCSDSDNPLHDDVKVIDKWHKERGYKGVGYHFFIKRDGTIQFGRPICDPGAHCYMENADSVGICLHGSTEFSIEQKESLDNLVIFLCHQYKIRKNQVYPHRHFNEEKTCPNFKIRDYSKIPTMKIVLERVKFALSKARRRQ